MISRVAIPAILATTWSAIDVLPCSVTSAGAAVEAAVVAGVVDFALPGLAAGGVEAAARYAELAEDVRAVGRLHARLTSLLNQLARVANSTGEVPAEMAAATAAVEKANGRVHEVLARVEEQVGSR